MAEEKKPDDTKPAGKKPDEKIAKKFAEMTSDEKLGAIYDLLVKVLEGNGDKTAVPEDQKKTGPVEMKAGEKNEKDSELFTLKGQVVALENRLTKQDEEKKKESLMLKVIENAKKELAKFSIADIDNKLKTISEKGEEAVKHFVAGIKESAVIDPVTTFDLLDGKAAENDPELMEFVQKGPEVATKAMEASRQFDLVKGKTTVSRKAFIQKFIEGGNSGAYITES